MDIQRATPINELLAKLIFLILPTAIVSYFLLVSANEYFSVIGSNALMQTAYFTVGMTGAAIFYSLRIRFLPTFLILLAVLYSIYKGLDATATGEFDAFFISVQFLVFAILFTAGWLTGWGFIRHRYFGILMSAAMLVACIILIAKSPQTDTVYKLLRAFGPALLYAVYIVFTTQQIYSYKDKSQKFWWYLTRRLVGFALLALLLLGGVVYLMRAEIKETVANYGGGGKSGENSMLQKNKDGTFDLKDYSRLRSNLGRSNELLFCAHIDNYFPNTEIPNPLYLTAFYYTKFDTLTETFERDAAIPSNDLFEPDPSKLPLFFTQTDSTVIKNSLADKLRRTVEIEVYSKNLSPSTYLAPHVGYFVQPITVEKDFRGEFKSAFRAKGYVSELNSAYFVYNAQEKQIKKFQEQRFDVLRKADSYEKLDKKFMSYYTYMPSDAKFKRISDLAHNVTAKANTEVDKVLAIRDYFLAKDENGEQIYSYTDNPGIPDIPSASKLMYFLFENKKGYCAYYAGATLFMLRSLGIPSRITVGFLTMDRSDKNKGWYWYYADQAHAWVQVYFPGYGWLDFDTTVGNSDAQESPKPDGTPPMQPPRAWLAADGIIQSVDTAKKIAVMNVRHFVFQDKEYQLDDATAFNMDVHIATIRRDSIDVPLAAMQKGDEATAVSYADAFKKLTATPNEKGLALMKRFPDPGPVDEVYLKRKDTGKPEEKTQVPKQQKEMTLTEIAWIVGWSVAGLVVLLLLIPSIIFRYLLLRHKNAKANGSKAYWAYQAANFYLHQLGFTRGRRTPMQYAKEMIDPQFGTSFTQFMNVYLKQKYAKLELTAREQELVNSFLKPFLTAVRRQTPVKQRLKGFSNPAASIGFFSVSDATET